MNYMPPPRAPFDKNQPTIPYPKKLSEIHYTDILSQRLGAMDSTATSFSMENHIPILLFGLDEPENIIRAVNGEKIGTIVGGTKK